MTITFIANNVEYKVEYTSCYISFEYIDTLTGISPDTWRNIDNDECYVRSDALDGTKCKFIDNCTYVPNYVNCGFHTCIMSKTTICNLKFMDGDMNGMKLSEICNLAMNGCERCIATILLLSNIDLDTTQLNYDNFNIQLVRRDLFKIYEEKDVDFDKFVDIYAFIMSCIIYQKKHKDICDYYSTYRIFDNSKLYNTLDIIKPCNIDLVYFIKLNNTHGNKWCEDNLDTLQNDDVFIKYNVQYKKTDILNKLTHLTLNSDTIRIYYYDRNLLNRLLSTCKLNYTQLNTFLWMKNPSDLLVSIHDNILFQVACLKTIISTTKQYKWKPDNIIRFFNNKLFNKVANIFIYVRHTFNVSYNVYIYDAIDNNLHYDIYKQKVNDRMKKISHGVSSCEIDTMCGFLLYIYGLGLYNKNKLININEYINKNPSEYITVLSIFTNTAHLVNDHVITPAIYSYICHIYKQVSHNIYKSLVISSLHEYKQYMNIALTATSAHVDMIKSKYDGDEVNLFTNIVNKVDNISKTTKLYINKHHC